MQPKTKRVFISYSHDSPEHRAKVLELSERLREDGVDARIDQYVEHLGHNWPDWCDEQIRDADLVLMVCTDEYRKAVEGKAQPGTRKGVCWEADQIKQEIYDANCNKERFVPVLFAGAGPDDVPRRLGSVSHFELTEYKKLFHRITGQPLVPMRPLGERSSLPSLLAEAMAAQGDAYLQRLREETGKIKPGSIDPSTNQPLSFSISLSYVPLHFIAKGESNRLRIEAALRNPRIIIQGDAGSGKSTFMRCAAFDLSHTEPGPTPLDLPVRGFPLYVRISELDGHIAKVWGRDPRATNDSPTRETDPAWFAHFLGTLEWGATQAFFETKMRHEKTILLLDGLDEAPSEASRERMAKLLGEAVHRYKECRIVVTTRPQALTGEAHPTGFEDVSIDRFDDKDIALFVERWSSCRYAGEPNQAERERQHLTEALALGEISELARNPLMLAALTVIHFNGGRLPDNRRELYESILRWLANSRRHLPGQPDWETRIDRLSLLALGMQTRVAGRVRTIDLGEAAELLQTLLTNKKDASRFLRLEEADSGILASRGESVEFVHLTFQEYLAAVELASLETEEIRKTIWKEFRLYSPEWREVMRFLAAELRKSANRLFDIVLNGTGPALADRARTVALLSLLRDELRRRDSDGNITEFRVLNPKYERFVGEMVKLFTDAEGASGLNAKTRAEAAEAWERLGDVSRLMTPADHDYWVDLGRFQIGQYAATAWEYRKFVEAGGPEPLDWTAQSLWPHRPVVGMNWQQAVDYCEWAGVRLQTSEQSEFAAAGKEGREYPWGGEAPDDERANFGGRVGRVTPVGLFPSGLTPDGIADLAGNVWEWTRSDFGANSKVARGASFQGNARGLRAAYRIRVQSDSRSDGVGFRCVRE